MSRSLHVIQTTAKVAHVVCRVLYVLTIVGGVFSLVGFVLLAALQGVTLDGKTVAMLVQEREGMHIGTAIASCLVGAIGCAVACVLFRMAIPYLAEEMADGTPFTAHGAQKLRRLGLFSIVLPLGGEIVSATVSAVCQLIYPASAAVTTDGVNLLFGLALILFSYVLSYGAEREESRKTEQNDNED